MPQPSDAQMAGAGAAALTDGSAGAPGPLQMAPVEDFLQRIKPPPQERLARMVDLNEERTAQILRKWVAQEAT